MIKIIFTNMGEKNMGKVELLDSYINRCEECISKKDYSTAYVLEKEIIAVFGPEIHNITNELTTYDYVDDDDYIYDLQLLKAQLINYKATLELDDQRHKEELKKLELEKSIISIQNTNTSNSSATAESITNVTLSETIDNVSRIDDKALSQADKDMLVGLISSLELAKKKDDKEKVQEKVGNILKFIADKAVQVGIAVLPV